MPNAFYQSILYDIISGLKVFLELGNWKVVKRIATDI